VLVVAKSIADNRGFRAQLASSSGESPYLTTWMKTGPLSSPDTRVLRGPRIATRDAGGFGGYGLEVIDPRTAS
jgi:hypothetical protein